MYDPFLQIRRRRLARLDKSPLAASTKQPDDEEKTNEPSGSSVGSGNEGNKQVTQEVIPEAPQPQEAACALELPRLGGMETGLTSFFIVSMSIQRLQVQIPL